VITIGIRAAPKVVTFAVYDSTSRTVINVEEIKIPAAFSLPDRLKYVRSNLLDVLREYKVERAGIRETEPAAQSSSIERVQIESVIQEAFASSELKGYYVGQIASISARIGIDRSEFKPLVDGSREYDVENWTTMTTVGREAVLCAVGAVNV
jgi:Holliday junction resolvasome RuvABC endonuclease subunit